MQQHGRALVTQAHVRQPGERDVAVVVQPRHLAAASTAVLYGHAAAATEMMRLRGVHDVRRRRVV